MATKSFWRKHYTGYTSGSHLGRDDGYPEPRTRRYTSIEALAQDHGTKDKEWYEAVSEEACRLTLEQVLDMVDAGNEARHLKAAQAQRKADEAEFALLAKRLGKEV